MTENWTLDTVRTLAEKGSLDTVLVCLVDMQGRLMGKRFHVQNFIDHACVETHCCNYLLATDLEMATPDGYASTSWQQGYGDYVMKPDLSTLRPLPWLEGTAMVLCDILDHHTHEPVSISPRQILKSQIAKLSALGYTAMMATELEFFLFENRVDAIRKNNFSNLQPISGYNEDYHIFQTTKEEAVMRPLRNHLVACGVPVENSKGEAETGQEELNIRYSNALACADHHTIAKHATKEIAWQHGLTATFMAKWHHDKVGSSSHVHQSLQDPNGQPVFYDPKAQYGMSKVMQHYVAGLIKFAPDYTYFLAPYINSYKRFRRGTFAPTKTAWSVDNRTAGFRLCGYGTPAIRMECRIGGSDLNPYLALAAQIAAGTKGITEKLPLPPALAGDIYNDTTAQEIPTTLREATQTLEQSHLLKEVLGEDVIAHYVRCGQWEQEECDRIVTDWEIARGFERA